MVGLAGQLAVGAGLALLGRPIGGAIEPYAYSPDTRRYLDERAERIVTVSNVPVSRQGAPISMVDFRRETYYPAAEDIRRAQEEEPRYRLEQTPEIPGVSQAFQAVGMGKVTTGGFFGEIGGGLLPGRIPLSPAAFKYPEKKIDTSIVGGGQYARQEQLIKQYGLERGLSEEEASKRAKALKVVGIGAMAGQTVGYLGPEIVGNVGAKVAGKALPGVVSQVSKRVPFGPQLLEYVSGPGVGKTVFRGAGRSAFASGVGASAESITQTSAEFATKSGKIEEAPEYISRLPGQIIIGTALGAGIEAPRGGVARLREFKTSELPKPLQVARKSGFTGGLERGFYGLGLSADAPEFFGDIASDALEGKVRAFGVSVGGSTSKSKSTSQVEAMIKAATVQRSGRSFAPAFSLAPSETKRAPAPSRAPSKGVAPIMGPFAPSRESSPEPSPDEPSKKGGGRSSSETPSNNALAESEAIAPGLSDALSQSRAYAPEKAPRIPLPFLGLPAAYGAASMLGRERKRYFNELSLFGRAFGGRARTTAKPTKKQTQSKINAFKKMKPFVRGVNLFNRGFGVAFNAKRKR